MLWVWIVRAHCNSEMGHAHCKVTSFGRDCNVKLYIYLHVGKVGICVASAVEEGDERNGASMAGGSGEIAGGDYERYGTVS